MAMNYQNSKTTIFVLAVVFLLLTFVLVFGILGIICRTKVRISDTQFERDIRKTLPIYSNTEQIEKYFQESEIDDYSWHETERMFQGIVRQSEKSCLFSANIVVRVYVNQQERLEKIEVEKVITGP